jgi:hypothetical protein
MYDGSPARREQSTTHDICHRGPRAPRCCAEACNRMVPQRIFLGSARVELTGRILRGLRRGGREEKSTSILDRTWVFKVQARKFFSRKKLCSASLPTESSRNIEDIPIVPWTAFNSDAAAQLSIPLSLQTGLLLAGPRSLPADSNPARHRRLDADGLQKRVVARATQPHRGMSESDLFGRRDGGRRESPPTASPQALEKHFRSLEKIVNGRVAPRTRDVVVLKCVREGQVMPRQAEVSDEPTNPARPKE